MKKFAVELLKSSTKAFVITTVVFGTAVLAVSFPTSTPVGQTAGGNFMAYFTKMLVSTNLATTDGTVKNADKVDGLHASEIGGGLSAAGNSSNGGNTRNYVVLDDGKTCPSGYAQFNMTDAACGSNIFNSTSGNSIDTGIRCRDGQGKNLFSGVSAGIDSLGNSYYNWPGGLKHQAYQPTGMSNYRAIESYPGKKVICIKN